MTHSGCPGRWVVGLVLAAVAVVSPVSVRAAERPNIVLLIADDLGYGEPGCYGGMEIPTPGIDRLARTGVLYSQGYVTAPFCAASRAGLLTGRYQTRFGFEFNPIGQANADPAIGLPANVTTWPSILRDNGYATALVGKWHLGGTAAYHPQRRGFDEFFGFLHEGHSYVPLPGKGVVTWLRRKSLPDGGQGRWTAPDGRVIWSTHMGHREPDYDADNPLLRSSQPVDEREPLTAAFTREAVDFLDRHRQQPFCLCVAYNAVHSPMQATDASLAPFKHIPDIHRRIFAGMLKDLDDSVGVILNRLEEHGLARNTLVVFLSDNGGPTRELTSSNAPLRGEKGQLYDGGIRVPFIVRWPGELPAGERVERPVISLDLAATALAAAGIAPPIGGSPLDGLDLRTLNEGPERELFWRVGAQAALRQGDWKLVRSGGRRGDSPPAWQLYNLRQDVAESHDLAGEQGARVQELAARWSRQNSEMVPPLWGGR